MTGNTPRGTRTHAGSFAALPPGIHAVLTFRREAAAITDHPKEAACTR
jgi:hypothetical protein